MSLELSSNDSNKLNLNLQEPASNVELNQIQHPGCLSSLRCATAQIKIRARDSNSTPIAEANWNMFNNTLTLTVKGRDTIVVGNSTTIQHQSFCDRCCQGEQIQTNSIDSGKVQTTSGTKLLHGIIAERTKY